MIKLSQPRLYGCWKGAPQNAKKLQKYRDSRQQNRPKWVFKYIKGGRFQALHEVHPGIRSLYYENEEKFFRPAFGANVGKERGFHHFVGKNQVRAKVKANYDGIDYSARHDVLPYILDCILSFIFYLCNVICKIKKCFMKKMFYL